MEHQKELEVFRKKDPPILTMEEMVESVHAVEALSQLLAKDKQTADVSRYRRQNTACKPALSIILTEGTTL